MSDAKGRYAIGIDLGTTTCSLAYIDMLQPENGVQQLPIMQWESEGATVEAPTLPSYCYLPAKAQWRRGQLNLPGFAQTQKAELSRYAVGELARQRAALQAGRVIHSAKSWLCHGGVDRRAVFLPWDSQEIVGDDRCSPVEVSSYYLQHLRQAWDVVMARENPQYRFDNQYIVITVPASFDEVASRLTIEAASLAGFPMDRVRLLEEPQAGFYAWSASLIRQGSWHAWRQQFASQLWETLTAGGQARQKTARVLVCDVGGGTTDLSLFGLSCDPEPALERLRVSEHILLGGDNIDLRVAALLEEQAGTKLSIKQWSQLVAQARAVKEAVFADPDCSQPIAVTIAGDGASLFAQSQSVQMDRAALRSILCDEFMPHVDAQARPSQHHDGLQRLGLPYAHDPAITKHLAAFIGTEKIDAILFAGGTLQPELLKSRILDQIEEWQGLRPKVLEHPSMVLAVSCGAAVYSAGMVAGQRAIRAGYPRNLYVEVMQSGSDNDRRMMCIVPKGFDFVESIQVEVPGLQVRTGTQVRFPIGANAIRTGDQVGELVMADDDMSMLPSLTTVLEREKSGRSKSRHPVPCRLRVRLSETGLLLVDCESTDSEQRWRLDFEVESRNAAVQSDAGSTAQTGQSDDWQDEARRAIDMVYGKRLQPVGDGKPSQLTSAIEAALASKKSEWSLSQLRTLWDFLRSGATRRSRSLDHEAAWLHLAGYVLRPGMGDSSDSLRIGDLWQVFQQGLCFPDSAKCLVQWFIMWRRVSAGLSAEQQERLCARVFPSIRQQTADPEAYLLAGALERMRVKSKIQLGNILFDQLEKHPKHYGDQKIWACARLAARRPLYAGVEGILPATVVEEWVHRLMKLSGKGWSEKVVTLFLSQAARFTDVRELDLSDPVRSSVADRLRSLGADLDLREGLFQHRGLTTNQQATFIGDSLPTGFVLHT